jgi:hypothetical protein
VLENLSAAVKRITAGAKAPAVIIGRGDISTAKTAF